MTNSEGIHHRRPHPAASAEHNEFSYLLQLYTNRIRAMRQQLDELISASTDSEFLTQADQLMHQLMMQSNNLDEIALIRKKNNQAIQILVQENAAILPTKRASYHAREQGLLTCFEQHFHRLTSRYRALCPNEH